MFWLFVFLCPLLGFHCFRQLLTGWLSHIEKSTLFSAEPQRNCTGVPSIVDLPLLKSNVGLICHFHFDNSENIALARRRCTPTSLGACEARRGRSAGLPRWATDGVHSVMQPHPCGTLPRVSMGQNTLALPLRVQGFKKKASSEKKSSPNVHAMKLQQ